MPKQQVSKQPIKIILVHGLKALKKAKVADKELKRFKDIYKTVYKHARSKGQEHNQALEYCWNVYSRQAPADLNKIISHVMRHKVSLNKKDLRKMIIKEMIEGDIVNIADFRKKPMPQEPDSGFLEQEQGYNGFLSEMHNQLIDFMSDSFDNLTPEQSTFLDNILDMIEEELGIDEEEGIDFDDDEDFEDDL